ncbi:MAG: gliding motility-associated-like protein [Bacteroidia bacterium]|jgi:gliding motility-associated-like protein
MSVAPPTSFMKSLILTFGSVLTFLVALSQQPEQDCFNAINVCTDTYVQQNSYSGYGTLNELPASSTCLGNGEMNSVWYIFNVTEDGDLTFQLNPLNVNDDYDFAVFDMNTSGCSGIASGTSLPIRCNYSAQTGSTGLSSGATTLQAGTGGPNQCASIPVLAGESYSILVSNFTASNSGYTLLFDGTASIIDEEPAEVNNADLGETCNPIKIWLNLNEEVDCGSIASDGSDFFITGPEAVAIVQANGVNCGSDGYSDQIRIKFANNIGTVGTYTVHLQTGVDGNTLIDRCSNENDADVFASFEVLFIGPDVEISDYQDSDCGTTNGWIQASVYSGTAPYNFEWNVDTLDAALYNDELDAGPYVLTVTDANGCQTSIDQALTYLNSPIISVDNIVGVMCNGGATGSATVNVEPGSFNGNLQYEWLSDPPQYTQTATGLPAGDVIVQVEDDGSGCVATQTITIPNISQLSLSFVSSEPACSVNDGVIAVNASGGAGPYQFSWNTVPPQNTLAATGLSPGLYQCHVTDDNGCESSIEVILVNDFAPDAMVNETLPSCGQTNGWASVTALTGQAPFSYTWNTAPAQFDSIADGLTPGNYFCTIADANGCTQIINVKIDSVPPPSMDLTVMDSDCGLNNGEVLIDMVQGTTPYVFTIGADSLFSGNTVSPLSPGNYTVMVIDSVGCTSTENFTVEMELPTSDFTVKPVCVGSEAYFQSQSTSMSTNFEWSFGDGNSSTDSEPVHTYLAPGVYEVTLDLSGGCAPDQVVKSVEIFNPPVPAYVLDPSIILEKEPFELVYSGDPVDSVSWELNGMAYDGVQVSDVEIQNEGDYPLILTAVNQNGCIGEMEGVIEVIQRPTLFIPNAFNPNGLLENRIFRVEGVGVTQAEFWVFDRWGKLLFEANNVNEAMNVGWDGTFQGKELPQGVYAYRIKATMFTGQEFERLGTITMVR